MSPIVRPATIADAPAIGGLHVRAWRTAYRGVMPDEYLDGLQADDRAAMWAGTLERADPDQAILVVEDGADVVGFAAVGPARGLDATGELYAINLDPGWWGRGFGSALLAAATEWLRGLDHPEAILWVVRENNRARRFYEHHGWSTDGAEKRDEVLGVTVTEVRYRRSLA